MPTYKINYSGGKFRVVNVNKLPNKTALQSLDRVYNGQPFVNTVSKFQDTRGLDTAYNGQPFYGHTDAYLTRYIDHPDVVNWLSRVSANGGSVSSSTILAVTAFCYAIDSASIRNKFARLNLFCGDNLNACMVPLYRGQSSTGTQFGNAVDTNFNFTNADYSERGASGGLKGDGSSKYLDSTVQAGQIGSNGNYHLSVYINQTDSLGGTYNYYCGNATSVLHYIYGASQFNGYVYGPLNSYTGLFTSNSIFKGHIIGTSSSSSSHSLYYSGVLTVNSTELVNQAPGTDNTFIFVGNGGSGPNTVTYTNSRIAGYSLGVGLTTTQASAYYNALQTFQTSLNRNV